jgi:hypothetical protein
MSWMNEVSDLLQRYKGASATTPSPDTAADFSKVADQAPPSAISTGLAEAFRSDSTPPFGQMLSGLFGQSDATQRAGILNHLIAAAGPAALSGGLLGSLTSSSPGAPPTVTPELAQQVPPDAVRQLADHAAKNDPSIIDRAGEFYAQHPTLVKSLGVGALTVIMSHLSQRH